VGWGATLGRILAIGSLPSCPRCGERMSVVREERLPAIVPVFELLCRCPVCGLATTARQVYEPFD